MPICKKCSCNFPNVITIDGKKRNLQNRTFCLTCSPFGKHNTKCLIKYHLNATSKFCKSCGTEKTIDEFYKRRNGNNRLTYCIKCTINQTTKRQQQFKKLCVEYKGGKCEKCNYLDCIDALEFHHNDPAQKDLTISHVKLTKFCDKIKKELDKCSLLCCRCHRELHWFLNQKYPLLDLNQ